MCDIEFGTKGFKCWKVAIKGDAVELSRRVEELFFGSMMSGLEDLFLTSFD